MDQRVLETQQWLNQTYGSNPNFVKIEEDGATGSTTVKALIRALQIEIGENPADGIFGNTTSTKFTEMFPNGLGEHTNNSNSNIVYIIQGGFYCRGINPRAFNGIFDQLTALAVIELQKQAGINETGIVNAKLFKAILTTDAFTLLSTGDENIRKIQQDLNLKYSDYIDLIPTNGIADKKTSKALIAGLQKETNITVDGTWGPGTLNACPTLQRGSTKKNLVYILQYALYINGFDPNGFDGGFGNGVVNAVKRFQSFVKLDDDGIVGKQTWASLLISYGDKNRTVIACDTSKKITHENAKILKNNGYQIVGRYLTGSNKGLTIDELDIIFKEGLKVFLIYQEDGTKKENFTHETGIQNACKAISAAKQLRIPTGSTIYFAIDFDATDIQVTKYILEYFKGILETFDGTYKIGVYGARNICTRVSNAGYTTSSFVTDASSGYSGNAGYKLPTNWTFDQIVTDITITDPVYGSLLIDKDVYSENIPAVDHLAEISITDKNASFKEKIHTLYNLAKEFAPTLLVSQWNRLVLQYLRYPAYADTAFTILDGPIDTNFIEYVNAHSNGELSPSKIIVYDSIYNIFMDLPHWAASTEVHLNFSDTPNLPVGYIYKDLGGWAGDLVYLAGQLQKQYNKNNSLYHYTTEQLYGCIGCNDDNYVRELGFSNYDSPAKDLGFNLTDLLQDADAFCLYDKLLLNPIDEVLISHFESGHKTRFHQFCDRLRSILTIAGDPFTVFSTAANMYTSKNLLTLPIEGIFIARFGDFDETLWGTRLATAFGNKLTDLLNSESE